MPRTPRVSIVIPAFNDEEWIAASLDSCLAQTERDIEIICVDDASSDATCEIIERYQRRDSRIRLIRQPVNRSAFQARRAGILAAAAPYVLFVDGDDLLGPTAAKTTLAKVSETGADVVGFGVEVLMPEGVMAGRFSREIQPKHEELRGDAIMPALFPVGKVAQGNLWRYLWDVELLRAAYASLPDDLELHRANDVPIAFLALAHARAYVSVRDELYRYHWRRGVSGQAVTGVDAFDFYLGALDSIDAIAPGVDAIARKRDDEAGLRDPYRYSRLSIIQSVLRYCVPIADDDVRDECFSRLVARAGAMDVILSAAIFFNAALPLVARHAAPAPDPRVEATSVAITTNNLRAGGLQGVVASQARHLVEAGYSVTIAARSVDEIALELPEGVEVVEMTGSGPGEKLASLVDIVRERGIDVVINHWLLYDDVWPFATLAAREAGVRMIGWVHNFALRPTFDFNRRGSLLATYLPFLERSVVLSKADVAFWKLRCVDNVAYLPNPPSPLLHDLPYRREPRTLADGPLRLLWWGRLQQHTKRVRDLVDVAAALRALGVDFHLTIVGPDADDMTAEELREYAAEKGVVDAVVLPGEMHGQDLIDQLDASDVYVCTSAIEGYPLTLVEAQAVGLPVAMYELPWLAVVQDNDGIVSAPQGDRHALAAEIAALAADRAAYTARSEASLRAAHEALSHDFTRLYDDLLRGEVSADSSPEPTLDDARMLLNVSIQMQESVVDRERRHASHLADQRNAARREAVLLRLENAKLNEPNVVTGIRPLGRLLLKAIPGLRPTARRFNRWVRGL